MTAGGDVDGVDAQREAALRAEARDRVRPLSLVARHAGDRFVCDLLTVDGQVAVAEYGSGPDELLAVLAAEQRYLVEQAGGGSVRGSTYLDKARERVRRGPASGS